MELKKEIIAQEVKETIERINTKLEEYYKKYYIEPEKSVCEYLYRVFANAYSSNASSLCSYIVKDKIFEDIEVEKDTNFHMCMNYLKHAVFIVLTHYNSILAGSTERVIRAIKNYSKEFLSRKNLEELNELINDISEEKYIEEHDEYDKIKELFDLMNILNENVRHIELKYVHELIGAKMILICIEERLSTIESIEDRYLKSTVCDFFRGYV